VAAPLVVGNEEHRFLVLDQLREVAIDPPPWCWSPGRNTAPASRWPPAGAGRRRRPGAGGHAGRPDRDRRAAFTAAHARAPCGAAAGGIAILGITPDRPETGYGYIRADAAATARRVVERFVEKPDLATAEALPGRGGYFWNAGMFVLRASSWMAGAGALPARHRHRLPRRLRRRAAPTPLRAPGQGRVRRRAGRIGRLRGDGEVPGQRASTSAWSSWTPAGTTWAPGTPSGRWPTKDAQGNASVGDAIVKRQPQHLVHATSRLVSVVGLDERGRGRDARRRAGGRPRAQPGREEDRQPSSDANSAASTRLHRKVHRPWGWYDSIDHGPRHQVKRIMVKPGASLSLQMHHHRAEHWIVVSGTAEVTNGDKVTC
jgi:mannose-1-phosphate guanylyltransferase/mannose-6-phosphate isomerase